VDHWLDRAVSRAGTKPSRRVVTVTQGLGRELIRDLTRLSVDGKSGKARHDHDHGDHDHDHGDEANPHVWLDPMLAGHCVSNIVEALCLADPAHAAGYRLRGERYRQELAALDAEIRASLQGLKDRKVVTFHDAFPYFCRRYDLELVGVIEEVPNVDPSPKYLARLSRLIRDRKVRVLFSEPQFHPRLLRRLADDLGIGVAELDVLETGKASPAFYAEGIRRNLRSLETALR
jgi:ABC-type Zn uptake system ZnuABC Zn-binding protein ZnuA